MRSLCLGLAFSTLMAFGPSAQAGERAFTPGDGAAISHLQCGVKDLSPAEVEEVERMADEAFRLRGFPEAGAEVVIPVAFHVISKGESEREGNVPESMLDDQIDALNIAYADMGVTFTKASVDRTVNSRWYSMIPGMPSESQAKKALVIDAQTTFNVYTASPGLGLLGWATWPWKLGMSPEMDGVVMHNETLPGGAYQSYNEGDTLVHEAGHWMGLYHTFQGGCSGGGDKVDDTPAEASATSGCPKNKDTCPGGGEDPIENFMDYSDDDCMFEFSNGQVDRALGMSGLFRRDMF